MSSEWPLTYDRSGCVGPAGSVDLLLPALDAREACSLLWALGVPVSASTAHGEVRYITRRRLTMADGVSMPIEEAPLVRLVWRGGEP